MRAARRWMASPVATCRSRCHVDTVTTATHVVPLAVGKRGQIRAGLGYCGGRESLPARRATS